MLKEQIKIIKEAEEQAEKIIQEGKNKASVITNSLNDKIEEFITLQEDFLKKSITEYSKTKTTDTAKLISNIQTEFEEQLKKFKKRTEDKKNISIETIWKELQEEFFK
jgi:hypothetical protein